MPKRVDFRKETKDLVRFNAGWICNNPSCRKIVIDNSAGVVGHIIGASPDGPRGNSDDKVVISSESNAIYLCKPCEVVVDNNPDDYPVEMLHRWKEMASDFFTKFYNNIYFGQDPCILPICVNPACQKLLFDYRNYNTEIKITCLLKFLNLKGSVCASCNRYIRNSKIPREVVEEWCIYSQKNWDFMMNSRVKIWTKIEKEVKVKDGLLLKSKNEILELEEINVELEKRVKELEREIHHIENKNDELMEANRELESLNFEFVTQNKEMKENMIKAESEKGYLFGLFDKS